jgi:hypothetical protein
MNVAFGWAMRNEVSEFSTRAGVKVPSTIAAVGTTRGTWGSAVTVTVRPACGSPASTMLRRNRSSGRFGYTMPRTSPVAALQHWRRVGERTGSDIAVCVMAAPPER